MFGAVQVVEARDQREEQLLLSAFFLNPLSSSSARTRGWRRNKRQG